MSAPATPTTPETSKPEAEPSVESKKRKAEAEVEFKEVEEAEELDSDDDEEETLIKTHGMCSCGDPKFKVNAVDVGQVVLPVCRRLCGIEPSVKGFGAVRVAVNQVHQDYVQQVQRAVRRKREKKHADKRKKDDEEEEEEGDQDEDEEMSDADSESYDGGRCNFCEAYTYVIPVVGGSQLICKPCGKEFPNQEFNELVKSVGSCDYGHPQFLMDVDGLEGKQPVCQRGCDLSKGTRGTERAMQEAQKLSMLYSHQLDIFEQRIRVRNRKIKNGEQPAKKKQKTEEPASSASAKELVKTFMIVDNHGEGGMAFIPISCLPAGGETVFRKFVKCHNEEDEKAFTSFVKEEQKKMNNSEDDIYDDIAPCFRSYWDDLDQCIDTSGSRIDFTDGTIDGDGFKNSNLAAGSFVVVDRFVVCRSFSQ